MRGLFKKLLGDRGERAAIRFLRKAGMRILARQVRNSLGEIDIIAMEGNRTVFVEVKTRTTDDRGQPFEAVDERKQQKIVHAALAWQKKNGRLETPSRFDVVSILWPDADSAPEIRHFRGAFEPRDRGQFFC